MRRIVGAQLGIEPRNLDVRLPLGRLGTVDELDFVEIIMAIEDGCAVTIDDSEASGLSTATIEQLAGVVDRKLDR